MPTFNYAANGKAKGKNREFHRLKSIQPRCNFDKINSDNVVYFKRGKDALAANFDPCHHCNKFYRSFQNS